MAIRPLEAQTIPTARNRTRWLTAACLQYRTIRRIRQMQRRFASFEFSGTLRFPRCPLDPIVFPAQCQRRAEDFHQDDLRPQRLRRQARVDVGPSGCGHSGLAVAGARQRRSNGLHGGSRANRLLRRAALRLGADGLRLGAGRA